MNNPIDRIEFRPGKIVLRSGVLSYTFPTVETPVVSGSPGPVQHPPATPIPASPAGASAGFLLALDATFGSLTPGATVAKRDDLFGKPNSLVYPWYIYGPADQNPMRHGPRGEYEIGGPQGDGCDGLYGNYRSRHAWFVADTPQDVHRIGPDRITLRGWCGLNNGTPDTNPPNVVSGIMRFVKPFRPGCFIEINCKMPKGRYSWPAFWLNPGEQKPWKADGTPGEIVSRGWPPEIDIFDQYGFNNTDPGHYLIAATPTGGNDVRFGSPGDLDMPGYASSLPNSGDAYFTGAADGWYAHTRSDLTADWHTYGLNWRRDNVLEFLLDGVVYRRRNYTWADNDPPAHLIASLQIGANFNDLSQMSDLGDAWDWPIRWIRAWTAPAA